MPSSAEGTGVDRNLTSYGDSGFARYLRRAFLASAGYDSTDLDRPVVGIADTTSDFNTCHRAMPSLVDAVRRGVLEAGGLPLVFPTMSLGEILLSPTSMLYRNLLAMETEELLRAQPMDAAVLLGGCDKTVPAQLMAAASADLPAILCVAGPMTTGSWRGERVGACTDCRRSWASFRAGTLDATEVAEVQQQLCPTAGTCMVMGTASTMACLTEALGMAMPGSATAPATSADRLRVGVATGRRAVELAAAGAPRPSSILTPAAFANALAVLAAVAGSTNAIVHLLAVARRAGVPLDLDGVHAACARTPVLVDCKPAGAGYLEDLHRAGGVPALLAALGDHVDGDAMTVAGEPLGATLARLPGPGEWQATIRPLAAPLAPPGGLVTLRGTLAPAGAVLKAAAATPSLLSHKGRAVVFDSPADAAARLDDPGLGLTADSVVIVRNAGPVGAGMPEAGSVPVPRHLAEAGVTDIVRVSDGRMSGTAYGTVVLHAAPEAAIGGPLALVRDGDLVELCVPERRIDLLVDPAELEQRRSRWSPPEKPPRGWRRLYAEHVLGAEAGCDLDFA